MTDASQLPGLFGFLATRFSAHPENVATEALAYVLRSSSPVARAFEDYVRRVAPIPGGLHYVTQAAADDRAIPDLAGIDASGRSPLLVEAKFWAGLTDQQPVAYLARLPEDETALLLFIVPSVRLELLWTEVLGRAGAIVTERGSGEYRYCSVGGQRVMAMTSWRALLLSLSEAATSAGDRSARSDLEQLHGLCDRMDSEAFIPLASADLSAGVGLRILHYGDIVTRAVDLLVTRGVASLKSNGGSLSSSAAAGWWGRYFAVGPVVCLLRFAAGPWARDRATPIWLQIGYRGQPPVTTILDAIAPLRAERGRVFPRSDFVDVAIDIPTNVELDLVLSAVLQQISIIANYLAPLGTD